MAMARTPTTRHTSPRGELFLLLTLTGGWLVPWLILTAATWIAGGHPRVGPLSFVQPGEVAARMRSHGPLDLWRLVGGDAATAPAAFWPATAFLCAAFTAIAIVTVRAMRHVGTHHFGSNTNVDHLSRWARRRDLHGLLTRRRHAGRFVIGLHGRARMATERETSTLVIGPTRSGKTTCLVIPNLFDWDGPAIVTSTKSELVDVTAAHRQTVGPVFVYDPTGELQQRIATVTWSPLVGCEDLDRAWTIASWLCAGLQQGSARSDADWAHWGESGKLLIAPLLFAAAHTEHTIVDVRTWIHGFDLATPMAILDGIMVERSDVAGDDAQRAIAMLTSIDQRPERERGTVFSTVMRIFNALNERAVAESAMTSRFDPTEFLARNATLYLCTPRLAPERVASLFVGILMTVVTEAYVIADRSPRGRLTHDLGLFLDELANVIPIEDLPSLASQGAGRGVVLMSIIQDISQLRARYGADRAHSILNNHACKVILPGVSDPETTELVARLVGRTTFTDVQVSRSPDGRETRSYSVRPDQMMTTDALRQLRAGTAVVLYRGRSPAMARLRPWYEQSRYRALSQRRFFRSAEHVSERASAQ
jgi:type IV secretion system protein VirD4